MIHELKILRPYFLAIYTGRKHFELRKNDRGYEVGHVLKLHEWDNEKGYSGHTINAEITYIISEGFGLQPGFVCMSIRVISIDHN